MQKIGEMVRCVDAIEIITYRARTSLGALPLFDVGLETKRVHMSGAWQYDVTSRGRVVGKMVSLGLDEHWRDIYEITAMTKSRISITAVETETDRFDLYA